MKKRTGIVLMMTLILITIIMGVTTLILTQSSRLSREGENSFSHAATMRVINDLEREFPRLLDSITGAEQLDLAMRIPLQIENRNATFNLTATLDSPYDRLNINRLLNADGNVNIAYVSVFRRLFERYPIADPDMFFKVVFDTIDNDSLERDAQTEIRLLWPDFQNGAVTNEKQFHRILERYIELTGDTAVLAIPWNVYIGFQGDKMDLNAVRPEVLSLILPGLSDERARSLSLYRTKAFENKDEAVSAEPQLASVFDTYFFIYQSKMPYNLLCDVQIQGNFQKQHVRFQYNLVDKKVKRVEFL